MFILALLAVLPGHRCYAREHEERRADEGGTVCRQRGVRSSYAPGGSLTTAALVLQLVVRYPLTVFSEESVFRGFLQVHLRWGIVAGSVVFALYHVGQWRTIPSLLPYALAGGVLVEWTGMLWPAAVVRYVLDAGW